MRIQRGKHVIELSEAELESLLQGYAKLHVDVGTGDGLFAYEYARAHPETFVIGLDAAGDRMMERSSRAQRKPAKGGAPNLLFVVASVESLPRELTGRADEVTVLYPWGSLLHAAVGTNPPGLAGVGALGRPEAPCYVLLNASVFEDRPYAESLGLPVLDETHVEGTLKPAYADAALEVQSWRHFAGDPTMRTSWGRHLVRGSQRRSFELFAVKRRST